MANCLADKIRILRNEALGNANLNWCKEFQDLLVEVREQMAPLVKAAFLDMDDNAVLDFDSVLDEGEEKGLLGFTEEEWDEIEAFAAKEMKQDV